MKNWFTQFQAPLMVLQHLTRLKRRGGGRKNSG